MYVIKSNRKTNSYTVRKINRVTQVVRVGKEGKKGEKGDQGDPATNLVQSVNGKQGVVVLNATDVGADPTGSASQALQDAKDYTDTGLSTKVDKEVGKGLSTNDYTTTEKNKLAGIQAGAEVNVQSDWNATSGDAQILNKPTIPSIAGLATEAQVQDVQDNLDAHEADTANPHNVTKAQVGLGNVDNTSDADKPVSTAQQAALNGKADFPAVNSSVPVRDASGLQGSIGFAMNASNSSIVRRTATGTVKGNTATATDDLVPKAQMDAADALKVNKAGDTMTGELINTRSDGVAYRQTRGLYSYGFGTGSDSTYTVFGYSPINATVFRAFPNGISIGAATNPNILYGTGFPNGVVSAPVGSTYIDTNATNGIAKWVKKSGSANTGWQPDDITSTVPATATSTGVAGQRAYDANFLYICTATNTWRRVAIASW